MSDRPRLAGVIRVERHGRVGRLFIDGDEFPYHLSADDPITVGGIAQDEVPTVRVTVLAERVELVNDLEPEPPEAEEKHL